MCARSRLGSTCRRKRRELSSQPQPARSRLQHNHASVAHVVSIAKSSHESQSPLKGSGTRRLELGISYRRCARGESNAWTSHLNSRLECLPTRLSTSRRRQSLCRCRILRHRQHQNSPSHHSITRDHVHCEDCAHTRIKRHTKPECRDKQT